MLTVKGLAKSFPTGEGAVRAVDGVSFSVAQGQCYALLGPSGCGKTTILRCVAGLDQGEQGSIAIDGRVVSDTGRFVPVHERSIGMVFQSYAIWPHLDVFDNVAYPLEVERPRVARAAIEQRVMDVLALVGMETMARRPATRLSGGQQQRVALARAIARRPSLLLLDEPLSNLDARLRDSMRLELFSLGRSALLPCSSPTTRSRRSRSPTGSRSWTKAVSCRKARRPTSMSGRRPCSSPDSWAPRTCLRAVSRSATARVGSGLRSMAAGTVLRWSRSTGRARGSRWYYGRKTSPSVHLRPQMTATPSRGGSPAWRSRAATSNTRLMSGGALLRVLGRTHADLVLGTPVWIAIDMRRVAVFCGAGESSAADGICRSGRV